MPRTPTPVKRYHEALIQTMRDIGQAQKWFTSPLNLGGVTGPGGGSGIPIGGLIGQLIQSKVAYDTTEAESLYTPPSGQSLVDNLNHIRYNITNKSSKVVVLDEGNQVASGVREIDFTGVPVTVTLASGYLDRAMVSISGVGGEITFTVAASGTTAKTKARVDYVCDGTDDNVQIQDAIDALPSNGGRIVLSDGTFNISDTITVPQGTTITGMGEQVTSIELPYDPDFDAMSLTGGIRWTIIRDLELLGNAPVTPTYSTDGIVITGAMIHLENLYIRAFPRNGIYATTFTHLRLVNVYSSFNKTGAGAYLRRAAIPDDSANQIYIEGGNYLANKNFGLYLYHVSNALIQVGNFDANETAGVGIIGGTNITLQNCWFESNNTGLYLRTGNIGVGRSNDANEITVKNTIFNSPTVWDIDAFNVLGIRIEDCRGTAIRLGASVSEIVYDHSFFTTETFLGTYIENSGAASSISDGGTIAHSLSSTPTVAVATPSVASEMVSITGLDATNITVAIKKDDGTAGTSQTIYWHAWV